MLTNDVKTARNGRVRKVLAVIFILGLLGFAGYLYTQKRGQEAQLNPRNLVRFGTTQQGKKRIGETDGYLSEYIIYNANIYDMSSPTNTGPQQAMAVQNGIVLELGTLQQLVERYSFQVVDMKGHTVLPGLTDSHAHLIEEGLSLVRVQLTFAESIAEVVRRIQAYIIEFDIQPGDWILGRGWDNTRWPGQAYPTKQDLDLFFPTNPIYLTRTDEHAGWANSAAIALADIPDEDPDGGQILRDEFGEPTGVFIDNAMYLIIDITPPPTLEQKMDGVVRAVEKCNSVGLTAIHDASRSTKEDIDVYTKLADQGRLNIRAYMMLDAMDEDTQDMYCSSDNPVPQLIGYRDRVTMRSVKVILDGALGSRGAAMLENYSDDDQNGFFLVTEEEYQTAVKLWANCEYQISTHAIGDRANRFVLDTYEELFNERPDLRDLRMRIEHAQILTAQDIPRFAELGVLPSVQPTHCTSDMRFAVDRVGPERAQYAYVWKTFLDQGVNLQMGSDFPTEQVDPFFGLYAAVSRQDEQGFPEGGFYPLQRVSIYDAVRGFTYMAAYGAKMEERFGSLVPGNAADFIVLDRNIIELADENFSVLLNTNVIATIFDGTCVYHGTTGPDGISLCVKNLIRKSV